MTLCPVPFGMEGPVIYTVPATEETQGPDAPCQRVMTTNPRKAFMSRSKAEYETNRQKNQADKQRDGAWPGVIRTDCPGPDRCACVLGQWQKKESRCRIIARTNICQLGRETLKMLHVQ